MNKKEIIENGNKGLEQEEKYLKSLLLSKLNHDNNLEFLQEQLLNEVKTNNQYIQEYLDLGDFEKNPKDTKFEILIDSIQKNELLKYFKKKLKKKHSISDEIYYSTNSIDFALYYQETSELLKLMDWYFENEEDQTHDKKYFIEALFQDNRRDFVLRNELLEVPFSFNISKKNLEDDNQRKMVLSLLKISLMNHYTLSVIEMVNSIYTQKNTNEVVSGNMLYLLLETSTFITLLKRYGFSIKELGIEEIIHASKKPLIKLSNYDYYTEMMSEFDHLLENAISLSKSYSSQRKK